MSSRWSKDLTEIEKEDYRNRYKGCGKERYKVANIDHCHKINQVRGLLCTSCNKGLGQFYDQPSLLVKASEYLRKFNQKCLN